MSSGYHPRIWSFRQPTTDEHKIIGTTKTTIEGRVGSKIDAQLGSSFNVGGITTLTSDGSIELKKSSSMYIGGNVYVTSDAKMRFDKDSYVKGETRMLATDIVTHTSDNVYISNHGVKILRTESSANSTGFRFYVESPTTAGQVLKLVMGSTMQMWINFNCSDLSNYNSKRTGLYNPLTGKSSALMIKLTTDFQTTGLGFKPAHIDLISLSTGSWLITKMQAGSSITSPGKLFILTSTTEP